MKNAVLKSDVLFELRKARDYCDLIREIFENTGRDLKILDKALLMVEDEIDNEYAVILGKV